MNIKYFSTWSKCIWHQFCAREKIDIYWQSQFLFHGYFLKLSNKEKQIKLINSSNN